MTWSLERTSEPDEEAVPLDVLKNHRALRLPTNVTDEDDALRELSRTATDRVEKMLSRALITQTWKLRLRRFPCGDVFYLPRPPLVSVTAVTYVDTNGTSQTVTAADYTVNTYPTPGTVEPAYGESWPSTRDVPNAVTVEYVAGYTGPDLIPAPVVDLICVLAGDAYYGTAMWASSIEAIATAERCYFPFERVYG